MDGLPPARDVLSFRDGLCAVTEQGLVCHRTPLGLGVVHEPFTNEHTAALAVGGEVEPGSRPPELRDDLRFIQRNGSTWLLASDRNVWLSTESDRAPPRRPVVFEDAQEIASGRSFVCARLEGGAVECAGPSFGPWVRSEPLIEAHGAEAIFAGEHSLCAYRASALHCWMRSEGARWARFEPARLASAPDGMWISDGTASWFDAGEFHRLSTSVTRPLEDTPWLMAASGVPRAFDHEVTPLDASALADFRRFRQRSARYVLTREGGIAALGSREQNLGEFAVGLLFSGGLSLLAAPALRVDTETQITALAGTVEIAAGTDHLCMRDGAGRVACSGANGWGQIYGRPTERLYPTHADPWEVELEGPATSLVAGERHTCALLEDGRVQCWGAWGPRQIASERGPSIWHPVPWTGVEGECTPTTP